MPLTRAGADLPHQRRGHGLVEQQPDVTVAGEVPSNHVVGYREEATIRTLGALDARLVANARNHSLAQAGAYPDLPVFRLSNRRGYTSSRPRKSERHSAIVSSDEES